MMKTETPMPKWHVVEFGELKEEWSGSQVVKVDTLKWTVQGVPEKVTNEGVWFNFGGQYVVFKKNDDVIWSLRGL
jgi:hypothetical protein